MSQSVIGAQLYTLRNFLKTPEDIAKSLKKVKEIGYDAVQVSGVGPIDPKELRKILDGEGHYSPTYARRTTMRHEARLIVLALSNTLRSPGSP